MAATRDLESSSEKTVRAVVSFFLATESGQTSSQPLHKEKFNVPISENDHKELRSFKHHLMQFTGLADIAVSKGLGKSNEDIRKRLRRFLKADDVQNKDRMAVDPLLRLSSPEVINTLKEVDYVVHQIIPEKYRFSETNKAGNMFLHPVAITCGQHGKLLFLDYNPLKSNCRLVKTDLHNPVRVKILKSDLQEARSLCYLNGTGTVIICQVDTGALKIIDLEDTITLRPSRLKDRASLVDELGKRVLSCTGTVKKLKERLQFELQKEKESYQSQGKDFGTVSLDKEIKPSSICRLSDDMLACSCDSSKQVFSFAIQSNGHYLCGKVVAICQYPEGCESVHSMCFSNNFLFLAHETGLAKFSLAASVMRENIVRNNSQECKVIPSVAPLPNGRIAFTDQDSRQVKLLARGGDVVVIAGTGVESNRNGSGSHASFGQPMGLCTECPNIFVTDGQIGTVKLVTTIRGTIEFLENLGKFNRAFSVYLKHQPREEYTIQEAHQMVKDVSAYV